MKTIFLLLIITPTIAKCQTKLVEADKDLATTIFQFIWDIEPQNIKIFHTEDDVFFKTLLLPIPEGDSEMEGEIKHLVYVLKGYYGEFPDGKLFIAGKYYNIQNIDIVYKKGMGTLVIKYGSITHPQEVHFLID